MTRITLSPNELEQKFRLGIQLTLARKGWLESALLNPRETEAARRNKAHAIQQLAQELAEDFARSKHEVTREALCGESEEILRRLRERDQRNLL